MAVKAESAVAVKPVGKREVARQYALRRALKNMDIGKNLILLLLVVLTFYPFVAMIFMSFKDNSQFIHQRWLPTVPFHPENYAYAWKAIGRYIWNSIWLSGVSAMALVLFSALSAYVLARFDFPGRQAIYLAIISLMMIPGILTLVPRFLLMRDLGLLNTYWVLLFPWTSGGQAFGIMLLRTFFEGLPNELFESARLDGASEVQVLARIAAPLSAPILGTLAIMSILGTWNDVIWPSVTVSDDRYKTLVFGLWGFQGMYYQSWGPLNAAYVIASIPLLIVFVFFSRLFIQGLTSGALKV